MKNKIDEAIKYYSNGNPIMSDEEYDMLLEEYLKLTGEENRPFSRQKQSDDVNRLVGTLPKVYGVTVPMRDGLLTYNDWVKKHNFGKNAQILAQPKFDGLSVAYDCDTDRFFTRGDVDNGESCDVTSIFGIRSNTKEFKHYKELYSSIKFECIVDIESFESLKQRCLNNNEPFDYVSPRAFASGLLTKILAGNESSQMALLYLGLIPLRAISRITNREVIPDELISISVMCHYEDHDCIQAKINDMLNNNATQALYDETYAVDGCVVSIINPTNNGVETSDEVAIKILNLKKKSKLVDIDCRYGTNGAITPVAIIEPVKFGNITVTNVTLSNWVRVQMLDLQINDDCEIMYNIVPYMISNSHTKFSFRRMEFFCPECGTRLLFNDGNLNRIECPNNSCPGKVKGRITRYCETMRLFGLSKGIVCKLYDAGLLRSIPDLYKLTVDSIKDKNGFGEISAVKIVDTIKTHSQDVPLSTWLSAFPFLNISVNTWADILSGMYYSNGSCDDIVAYVSDFIKYDDKIGFINAMVPCKGVTVSTIKKVSEGVFEFWDDIKEVFKYVTIQPLKQKSYIGKIAMSGTRDQQLTEYLESKGYEVGSFTNDCKALVVPSHDFKSSKVSKAQSLNIPIYTIDEIKEKV